MILSRSLVLQCALVFLSSIAVFVQQPQDVVAEYTRLGQAGELLTAAGWSRAQQFFLHHFQLPQDVYVTENHAAKLMWIKDNKAEVDQEYEPIGKIDSSLRFTPPPKTRHLKLSIAFNLSMTDKYWKTGTDGKERAVASPSAWRIENPQVRWASAEAAIRYTEQMSSKTDNPVTKENGAKTIAILKRYLSREKT